MKYTLANTIDIDKPQRVFDANGVEIDWVIECDTETGEVCKYKGDLEFTPETRTYPAPLRVEPMT
mgnify:CR=1 FL=1